MNERIKELAIKSKLLCDNGNPRYCGEERDIAEFAKLIVQDCAFIADKNWHLGGTMGVLMKDYFNINEPN